MLFKVLCLGNFGRNAHGSFKIQAKFLEWKKSKFYINTIVKGIYLAEANGMLKLEDVSPLVCKASSVLTSLVSPLVTRLGAQMVPTPYRLIRTVEASRMRIKHLSLSFSPVESPPDINKIL